jgi:lipopolysaccharide biosynthesis glycosyltransferase
MAEIAIRTFRQKNPDIHIDLMCDADLVSHVKIPDIQVWTCPNSKSLKDVFMRKLVFFQFVDFKDGDKVMYVDSDIVTKKKCDHYFDVDFGAFEEGTTASPWFSLPGYFQEEIRSFNSGLMVFTVSDNIRNLYKKAAQLYLQNLHATSEQAILNNVFLKAVDVKFFDSNDILLFATYKEVEKSEGKVFVHLSGLGQSVDTKLKFMKLYEDAP